MMAWILLKLNLFFRPLQTRASAHYSGKRDNALSAGDCLDEEVNVVVAVKEYISSEQKQVKMWNTAWSSPPDN